MDKPIQAVTLHDHMEPCTELEGILTDLSLEVHTAKQCSDAWDLITKHHPAIVFVDLNIWRQSRNTLIDMAIEAEQTFNVIVVGALPDIEKYVSALEHGAFNFIAPPFNHDVLTLAVHSAANDTAERRRALATDSIPRPID